MRYLFLFRIVLTIIFVSVLANKGYCQQKPNIIFILADDLGSSELGCYGQTKIQTPHINRLAAQGMKFTKFYAGNNVCAPSRCSLLTGKHPGHATIRDNREDKPEGQQPLLASDVTLASLLKKQGYTTAAIGKWGLGMFGTTGDPLRHGFDSFFGYNCQRHAHSHYPAYLYRNDTRFALPGNLRHTGTVHSHDLLDVEAEKFLRENATKPFFLFLPVTLPHVAVQVPERDLEQYVGKFGDDPPYDGKKGYFPHPQPRTGYAAMVSKIDRTVGKIVSLLETLNLSQNTLILFSSDNGPTHNVGGADSIFFESAGKLRGYKGSMYEGGLRVPFIAVWKGKIAPGSLDSHRWAFWDILPTLCELAGTPAPPDTDGISFLPTLLGQDQPRRHSFLYWESPGYGGQQAIIADHWKAVRQQLRQQANNSTLKTELYHLEMDESETNDLAEAQPEILKEMIKLLEREHQPSVLFPLPGVDPSGVNRPQKNR